MVCITLMVASVTVNAQELRNPMEKLDLNAGIWIQVSSGPSMSVANQWQGVGISAFISKKLGENLLSFRATRSAIFFGGLSEYGFLYGRLINTSSQNMYVSLNAGLGVVYETQHEMGFFGGRSGSHTEYLGIGVPFQADVFFVRNKYLQLGVTGAGNAYSEGVVGSLSFGVRLVL